MVYKNKMENPSKKKEKEIGNKLKIHQFDHKSSDENCQQPYAAH